MTIDATISVADVPAEAIRYAAKRAKVPTGVHILRHTFCSHLAMQGGRCEGCKSWSGIRAWR